MKRPGFTVIELLLATTMSALLMVGVLVVMSGLARDARSAAALAAPVDLQSAIDLLQWDLANARTASQSPDHRTVILIGHGSIAPESLRPNGRLVQVTYSARQRGSNWCLYRTQQYLDDPIRPQPWTDLVAQGVSAVEVVPVGSEQLAPDAQSPEAQSPQAQSAAPDQFVAPTPIPQWVRLRMYGPAIATEKQMCVK